MKHFTTLISLIFFTSCIFQPKFVEEAFDETGLCYGLNLQCNDRNHDKTNDDLDNALKRLDRVEKLLELQSQALSDYSNDLDVIINDILGQIEALQDKDVLLDADIADIQSQLDSLDNLSNLSIAEIIDPCGDNVGYFDEVLLKLNDNTILAYFEHGNRKGLSVLSNGNYETQDDQKCEFNVNNGNITEI